MAKALYDGVNGIARKVKKKYDGVNGIARKVKKAYDGVNGIARQYWSSEYILGDLAVGTSVYMSVNGARKEFLVVHQGLPSSIYDSSCNDTWLMMKDIYDTNNYWGNGGLTYATSSANNKLKNTILKAFDTAVQNIIKQVKIPYQYNSNDIRTGSNGFSTKLFLLSMRELGATSSSVPNDGAPLSYFDSTAKRIANYNGAAAAYWTRSTSTSNINNVYYVTTSGGGTTSTVQGNNTYKFGLRPALILPKATLVSSDFDIIAQ